MEFSLCYRQAQVHRLALSSDYFESVLTRTESALRKCKRAQQAIELLADGYESLMDCLLAVCSPEWGAEVAAYYRGDGAQMIEAHSAETIAAVDRALAPVVRGLSRAVKEIGGGEWPAGSYYREILRNALRNLVNIPRP